MPTMPTEMLFIADERQLSVILDPRFTYAPSPIKGTVHWVKVTRPTSSDPRSRLR